MKFISKVPIQASGLKDFDSFGHPDNVKEWQGGFGGTEPIKGAPGHPGPWTFAGVTHKTKDTRT